VTQYSFFQSGTGNGATPPASSSDPGYGGNWVAGLAFEVTSSGQYLYGFYLWRADTSTPASSTFALWTQTSAAAGTVIAATEVSGSGFTAGAWNYVPLATPYALSTGVVYKAVYGYSGGGFPETKTSFGTGGAYAAGIVSGPITAYSSPTGQGGTNQIPFTNAYQGSFDTATASASTDFPVSDDSQANFWIDILVGPAAAPPRPAVIQAPAQAPAAARPVPPQVITQPVTSAAPGVADAAGAADALAVVISGIPPAVIAAVPRPAGPDPAPVRAQVIYPGGGASPGADAAAGADAITVTAAVPVADEGGAADSLAGGNGPWRLWPATSGPASATAGSGDFIAGVNFTVTQGNCWFEGYWWWVASSGQSASPVKCALWSVSLTVNGGSGNTVIPGSVVTSGPLTAGQWNWIPLPVPLLLSPGYSPGMTGGTSYGSCYCAAVGVNGNFPDTGSYWGTDITNGPLLAYSGTGGSYPAPYGQPQGCYSTAGSDPSVTMPATSSGTDNFWVDVQVGTAPAGYSGSYRLWPGKGDSNAATVSDDNVAYNIATEIDVTAPVTADFIHYFVPNGASSAAGLATAAAIWDIAAQAAVAVIASPSWVTESGGTVTIGTYGQWVKAALPPGTVLTPGKYRVSVYNANGAAGGWGAKDAGTSYWYQGVGQDGITQGPLSAPPFADAQAADFYPGSGTGSTNGQPVFSYDGSDDFPHYSTGTNPAQNYWVDLEATPLNSPAVITAPPAPPAQPQVIAPQVIGAAVSAPVPVTLADVAAAADGQPGDLSVAAVIAFADAAGAYDQQAPYADEAAAADTLAVTAAVPLADAAGAEEYGYADGMRQDQGGAADALAVTAAVPLPDAAGAVEWSYADGSRDDSGGSAEQVTVTVTVPLADAGAAAETFNAGNPYVYDQAGAAETLATQMTSAAPAVVAGPAPSAPVLPPIPPQVIGGQSPAVPVSLADVAAGTDQQYADGSRADTAGGTDALTATVTVPLADVAGAAELTPVTVPDAAGAAEALTVVVGPVQPDAAGAADVITAAVTGAGWADTAGAAETFTALSSTAYTGRVEWLVSPLPSRWHATPLPLRWEATLMNFGPIAAISLEEVNVLWNTMLAGTELDPTGQTQGQSELVVEFAFPVSSGNPLAPAQPGTWFTGSWLTGTNIRGYVAQALVGPGGGVVTLTAGQAVDVWCQVVGTPENPKKFAGALPVY
jgi:hypothetical protein